MISDNLLNRLDSNIRPGFDITVVYSLIKRFSQCVFKSSTTKLTIFKSYFLLRKKYFKI